MENIQLSPETLEKLGRFNKLTMNVFSLDTILRLISYTGLGVSHVLQILNDGKPTPLGQYLADYYMKVSVARFINRTFSLPIQIHSMLTNKGGDLPSKIMDYSMLAYFPLELGWFMSIIEPKMINIDSPKWSQWSLRAFVVYCIAAVYRCMKASVKLTQEIEDTKNAKMESSEQESKIAALKKQRFLTNLSASSAAGDILLGLQYSFATPIVDERIITIIGIWGGLAGCLSKWIQAAPAPEAPEKKEA